MSVILHIKILLMIVKLVLKFKAMLFYFRLKNQIYHSSFIQEQHQIKDHD